MTTVFFLIGMEELEAPEPGAAASVTMHRAGAARVSFREAQLLRVDLMRPVTRVPTVWFIATTPCVARLFRVARAVAEPEVPIVSDMSTRRCSLTDSNQLVGL